MGNTVAFYKGPTIHGKCNGHGVEFYDENLTLVKYEGWFKDNFYHGKGTFYDRSGLKVYKGYFKNGTFDGEGKKYNIKESLLKKKQCLYYKGSWKNGLRNGYGEIYTNEKMLFKGYFKNDWLDGNGILYYDDGKTAVSCKWNKSKAIGRAQIYTPNGTLYKGYLNGELCLNNKNENIHTKICKFVENVQANNYIAITKCNERSQLAENNTDFDEEF